MRFHFTTRITKFVNFTDLGNQRYRGLCSKTH